MTGDHLSVKSLLAIAAAIFTVAAAAPATNFAGKADYVIVGGGPAGFVLAEQLSQNPNTKIILLEAGPDGIDSNLINTPAYYPLIQEYFWNYTTQPDPNLGGNTPGLTQGRVFGGGTAVNGMAYCRGAASVFDEWAEVSWNPGLAWHSLLDDFRATSHYTFQPADYQQYVNTSAYGDGPLEVSRVPGLTGFDIPFAAALSSVLGVEEVDMTDGTGIGLDLGLQSISVADRRRSYARSTYGRLIQSRPNVQMITGAWVHHIGFSGKTAKNVTYINALSNQTSTVKAKEIIVSGGAINSPKLLMLSGVGPKEQLSKLGIPVVTDIPAIGTNLYNHLFPVIELKVTPDVMTVWQWSSNATEKPLAEQQYRSNASGPLAWDNGLVYAAFRVPDSVFEGVNGTHYTSLPKDRPHVLIEYSTVPFLRSIGNTSVVTAWASLVQPEASGYVTLRSKDYREDPLIHANYFGSEADKAAVRWGYKKLREIGASNELESVVRRELYPGSNVTTDEDVWAAIQQQSFSFHHPVGSVAIGKALDSNWRLKGLKGIRVVDSSTFPTLPSCHPQADVYALAHRAAKDIRDIDGN
ncbi:MAG: hypothetical protein Q9190_000442 [Brigantiaea leucoxantha]